FDWLRISVLWAIAEGTQTTDVRTNASERADSSRALRRRHVGIETPGADFAAPMVLRAAGLGRIRQSSRLPASNKGQKPRHLSETAESQRKSSVVGPNTSAHGSITTQPFVTSTQRQSSSSRTSMISAMSCGETRYSRVAFTYRRGSR